MKLPTVDEALHLASELILEHISEGVIITDTIGPIVYINAVASHGVAPLDVKPNAYSGTYHLYREDGRPYPSHELPFALVMQGETVMDARWRIRRPDGRDVLAIGSAQPPVGDNGRRIGAILMLRDDTVRDALERELRACETAVDDAHRRLAAPYPIVETV